MELSTTPRGQRLTKNQLIILLTFCIRPLLLFELDGEVAVVADEHELVSYLREELVGEAVEVAAADEDDLAVSEVIKGLVVKH